MSETPMNRSEKPAADDGSRAPSRLILATRVSLRAAAVYARVLSDRFELAIASDPAQLESIPTDLLLHIEAVSEAFQGGARHTLWFIEPEVARNAQVVADLARDGAAPEGRS